MAPAKSTRSPAKPARAEAKPTRSPAKPARAEAKSARANATPARANATPARANAKPARANAKPARANAKPSTMALPLDAATGALDVSGAESLFTQLLTGLARHAPSSAAVAVLHGLISDEQALHDGVTVSSDKVIADAMAIFATAVPHLLRAPFPGYGPKRAHYALTLAVEHARAYAAFVGAESQRADAAQSKTGSILNARKHRALLHGVLGELAHGDRGLHSSLAKAVSHGTTRTGQLVASLDGLTAVAHTVLHKAASNPGLAEVLTDMALTPDTVRLASSDGRQIVAASTAHTAQRAAVDTESTTLNRLDGRVWFEIDALVRAAARARDEGRDVPALRLEHTGYTRHRHPAPPVTDPASAAPAHP